MAYTCKLPAQQQMPVPLGAGRLQQNILNPEVHYPSGLLVVNDLRLKVVASSIDGKGVAKLDCESYRALKLSEGTTIIVTYGAKSMELTVKLDNVFSAATARLMKTDMTALRVEEGMQVTVTKKNGTSDSNVKEPAKKSKGRKKDKANAASLDSF